MLDQICNLHGEGVAKRVVGKTSENRDSVGEVVKNRVQEVHRARQSSPRPREIHVPNT